MARYLPMFVRRTAGVRPLASARPSVTSDQPSRLSGDSPLGLTTVSGVPTAATVIARVRLPGHPADGTFVASTESAFDGTWELLGMDPALRYDVVARLDGENDALASNVLPHIPLALDLPTTFTVRRTEDREFTLSAHGGEGPYSYSVVSGTLPTGVALVGDQLVATAPWDTAGAYPITIEVEDARLDTVQTATTIDLVSLPLHIDALPMVVALNVADPFSLTAVATFGTPGYTYAVASGALPAGVSLNTSTGAITGAPTTLGAYSFAISVTDAAAVVQTTPTVKVYVTAIVPHKYWRLWITATNGGLDTSLVDLKFRAPYDSADATGAGAGFSISDLNSSFVVSNAYDGNGGTRWAANSAITAQPHFIGREMESPFPVLDVVLTGSATTNQSPNAFDVQSSDDGETWTTEWSVTGQTGWTVGQVRTFVRP